MGEDEKENGTPEVPGKPSDRPPEGKKRRKRPHDAGTVGPEPETETGREPEADRETALEPQEEAQPKLEAEAEARVEAESKPVAETGETKGRSMAEILRFKRKAGKPRR